MSLRILWNSLLPDRRRRRYYFLRVVAKLKGLGLEPAEMPPVFDVTPAEFAAIESGRRVPRLFVQTLAILAYKVPAPPAVFVYGPVLIAIAIVIPIATYLLLHR